jgi:hypothetical protein
VQKVYGSGERNRRVCRLLLELIDSVVGLLKELWRGDPTTNQVLGTLPSVSRVIPIYGRGELPSPLTPSLNRGTV